MDSLVTDRTNARASAPSPAYWAPITDMSPGSVSATGRVRGTVWPEVLPADGFSVGNSEEALPPGFRDAGDPLPLR